MVLRFRHEENCPKSPPWYFPWDVFQLLFHPLPQQRLQARPADIELRCSLLGTGRTRPAPPPDSPPPGTRVLRLPPSPAPRFPLGLPSTDLDTLSCSLVWITPCASKYTPPPPRPLDHICAFGTLQTRLIPASLHPQLCVWHTAGAQWLLNA